jgi:N-carbamoyl-L-amino-acid hydrolase
MTRPNIDIARVEADLTALAEISEHPAPAVTRVLFSDADLKARSWILKRCEEAGLELRTDEAGNLFARWHGTDPSLPPIATGSHIDAIPNAGKYDGIVGVIGGLEAIRSLKKSGHIPRRSIELVVFTAEEPTRFGVGCLGSRLLSGVMSSSHAQTLKDDDGLGLNHWRSRAGLRGDLESVKLNPGFYSAFIELHIEQGPLLEAQGIDIGIVEKIAAPAAFRAILTGSGGHAGAVLMPGRKDALLAGAEIALAVEQAALTSGSPDTVGTTGVFEVKPGAINSIPCAAKLEIDLRDTTIPTRNLAEHHILTKASEICKRRGIELDWETINSDEPAICAPALVERVSAAANTCGLSSMKMISRAYHDSLFMARITPVTMIFIPCHLGYSHRPDEYSSPEAIGNGIAVLAETLRGLSE